MQTPIRIYECRCGQYTPVTATLPTACSRCGHRDFRHVMWFELTQGQVESKWLQAPCPPDGDLSAESASPPASRTVSIHSLYVDNQQESRLNISRARAMLDYLEMLHRDGDVSDDQYQIETQRVLRRVVRAMHI